jgi:hypothetical protein
MKIEDMTIDQLNLHLSDLNALLKYTRSESDKGELCDSIKLTKERIKELTKIEAEKKISFNKEAPARVDHTENNKPPVEVIDNNTIGTIIM